MQIIDNIVVFGDADDATLVQARDVRSRAEHVALMADNHLGYVMPIGGVAAYRNQISVVGVGFDIACVDRDSEYLSPTGWKRIVDYREGEQIMQYNPATGKGDWVVPAYVDVPCAEFFHLRTVRGVDQMLSPNHRMLLWRYGSYSRRKKEPSVILAQDFVAEHTRLKLGLWGDFQTAFDVETPTSLDLTDAQIRVQVMANADGSLDRQGKILVSVKKARKKARAREILTAAGIAFTERDNGSGYTNFRFSPPLPTKSFAPFWGASHAQLCVVAEECWQWDGSTKERCFYTTVRADADFIQYAFAATGRRTYLKEDVQREGREGVDYRVFAYDTSFVGMRGSPKTDIVSVPSPDGRAYCFTVPTGFWVMRRGGNVVMTGNCGNAAIKTNRHLDEFDRRELVYVANEIEHTISFGIGRKNKADDAPVGHPLFEDVAWEAIPAKFRHNLQGRARSQLGTVGSGNHYVDVFADEEGWLWVGVHFGSRGFGHTVASGFLNLSQGLEWEARAKEQEVLLDLDSPLGQDYFALMNLAGQYAYAGREWVARKVVSILGAEEVLLVHNHHNFAWKELQYIRHEDGAQWEEVVVVRKGATPAFPGQLGFIGGSMGDDAVIVQGAHSPSARAVQLDAMFSTVHGAGRVMSRTAAAGKRNRRTGELKSPGLISPEMMQEWLEEKGVILRGGGLDEAPQAYRRLPEVLSAQGETIEVLHTLRPLIVAMAGANEYDPFKD